jgi:hypothetical protein
MKNKNLENERNLKKEELQKILTDLSNLEIEKDLKEKMAIQEKK